jgi:threonine dehydrogenase-like Zn-dependent dehydrogenase
MLIGLETDSSDILNKMMMAVRKGGIISIIGNYIGTTNGFNIVVFKGNDYANAWWTNTVSMILVNIITIN